MVPVSRSGSVYPPSDSLPRMSQGWLPRRRSAQMAENRTEGLRKEVWEPRQDERSEGTGSEDCGATEGVSEARTGDDGGEGVGESSYLAPYSMKEHSQHLGEWKNEVFVQSLDQARSILEVEGLFHIQHGPDERMEEVKMKVARVIVISTRQGYMAVTDGF
ncbi:uncharacterized protein N7459_002473 [Penicillium hispanicum]|uniref:uncharacterized protein n=1 Tax=Penicillium hispanicum TaxID=1080232 RepID=UPI00254064FC|nr:uncharacterized protein N7459_002473 [Penicillium hispanicum]KAJ5586708.1 hypothetical protein N7459_002473 [Penicillium hispanicum]